MTAFVLKRHNPRELPVQLAGKLLIIILALTLMMCGATRAFANPMPKLDVTVKGEHVRLGDVFDGLTQNADFVLAPAPGPGQELVWNQATLLRIATAFDLPWRPDSDAQVHIRRAVTLVDADTLRAVVRDYLAEQDVDQNVSYKISFSTMVPEIIVSSESAPSVRLADFNLQQAGGTFTALFQVSSNGKTQNVDLRGVAERMIRVPVLNRDVRNGDIITPENISWTMEKASTMRKDTVRNANDLIGSTPRKSLTAGELIRSESVQMPRMVGRGDLITLVYNQNGMFLTAKGRALEDGAMGQAIKVSNTSSNRTITARVTADKEVTVN